jgi:hypothetical protein
MAILQKIAAIRLRDPTAFCVAKILMIPSLAVKRVALDAIKLVMLPYSAQKRTL